MNHDYSNMKTWLQRNWKWILILGMTLSLGLSLLISLTGKHLGDFGKAYTEPQLYEGAVKIAQTNKQVTSLLGELQPVTKMAILEGDIDYTDKNSEVNFSVRIRGTNGKAKMSAKARRMAHGWEYEKISLRIISPSEKSQILEVK